MSRAYSFVAGSNMHCSVGLAILVKVGPISDCFDGGTQCGLDCRHAGFADAAQQGFAQIGIFDGRRGVIVQTTANGFGMRPASDHMGRAQPHELAAWIWNLEQGAERVCGG